MHQDGSPVSQIKCYRCSQFRFAYQFNEAISVKYADMIFIFHLYITAIVEHTELLGGIGMVMCQNVGQRATHRDEHYVFTIAGGGAFKYRGYYANQRERGSIADIILKLLHRSRKIIKQIQKKNWIFRHKVKILMLIYLHSARTNFRHSLIMKMVI